MEALPRTTARPRARTGVRLQSSHVEAISTLAVRLFRQQFAPQLDAVEWAPRLPCSSGGLMRDRLGGAAAPNQCSIQSALGLISAQQPDFTEQPADEGVAARALEREHVLEDRRKLFT